MTKKQYLKELNKSIRATGVYGDDDEMSDFAFAFAVCAVKSLKKRHAVEQINLTPAAVPKTKELQFA